MYDYIINELDKANELITTVKGYVKGIKLTQNKPITQEGITKQGKLISFPGVQIDNKIVKPNSSNELEDEEMLSLKKGSIRKRKNGLYEIRFYDKGKIYSVYSKYQKEAYKKYKTKLKELNNIVEKPQTPLLFDWLEEWYVAYKLPNIAKTSSYAIKLSIEKHIKTNFKNKQLQEYQAIELERGLSKIPTTRTRLAVRQILNNCFLQAVNNDFITSNPISKTTPVKHIKEKGMALTVEEQNIFIENIKNNRYEKAFLFALYSGARRGEVLSLQWEDINYQNKTIHIRGTKTIKSNRQIPLFQKIEELLPKNENNKGKIFKFSNNLLSKEFSKICPTHTFHDLRHTFATRTLEKGIQMKTIQVWLGHSQYSTTANIYTDITTKFEQEEINKLEE